MEPLLSGLYTPPQGARVLHTVAPGGTYHRDERSSPESRSSLIHGALLMISGTFALLPSANYTGYLMPDAPGKTALLLAAIQISTLIAISVSTVLPAAGQAAEQARARLEALIPKPVSVQMSEGTFALTPTTSIVVDESSPSAIAMGHRLAEMLRPATGHPLMVRKAASAPVEDVIEVKLSEDEKIGDEGYRLTVSEARIVLSAASEAGLFYGTQTLRQLLPPEIERASTVPGPWEIAASTIVDRPRFEWRGAMLDVSRHFFAVDDVKHVIDLLAMYKMNRLHLHLSDDQGWRIEIKSWPKLALLGGRTQVGGGEGGYYTQDDYREIISYAMSRFITIVPEIDMPGHTNAALSSYAELNCDGQRPEPYTGIRVGFSALCVDRPETYKFVDDVMTELAMLTPGPYLHVGGDEVENLTQDEYNAFIERVERIVRSKGKRMVGWDEIAHAELGPTSIVQHWRPMVDQELRDRMPKLIMSHSNRMYLDMKYDSTTALGLSWAGMIEVDHAYDWEPMDVLVGVPEDRVVGIESPLWSETLETRADIEHMMFPRLPGYAEIAWTARHDRSWTEYRDRLAPQAARWELLNINFYRSPVVDW